MDGIGYLKIFAFRIYGNIFHLKIFTHQKNYQKQIKIINQRQEYLNIKGSFGKKYKVPSSFVTIAVLMWFFIVILKNNLGQL